jgi:hypothetical protein
MKSFVITNLCTKTRISTKDNVILQLFSGFYSHPAMINEDGWHLFEANGKKILVDEDTLFIMKDMVCEWGCEATSDVLLTCKLTSSIEDESKRMKQWNDKYKYAMDIKKASEQFFDKNKLDDLSSQLEKITVSANTDLDSAENSEVPENIPVKQE